MDGRSATPRGWVCAWAAAALSALLTVLVAFASGCQRSGQEPSHNQAARRTLAARGVVRQLEPDGHGVVIQHEAISNYMEAMTMRFRVQQTNELTGLRVGDEIRFRLQVTDEESWVEGLERIGRAAGSNLASVATGPTNAANATNALNPTGADDFRLTQIPDFALTNEFGEPIRLRDFQGQAVAMTFFFTRCPIPEYCPRLARNFQGAVERLKAIPGGATNFRFLSVSFDPLDSPLLLRAYGRQYHYDSNHWSFITGKREHVRELAEGFGVPITPAGASYTHGFRTVIFDATGRLQTVWPIGGDMTDQLVGEMTKAARVSKPAP